MANWKALYTTRGLCECVANSLTRAVLNAAMGGARLLQPLQARSPALCWGGGGGGGGKVWLSGLKRTQG